MASNILQLFIEKIAWTRDKNDGDKNFISFMDKFRSKQKSIECESEMNSLLQITRDDHFEITRIVCLSCSAEQNNDWIHLREPIKQEGLFYTDFV